MADFYNFTSVLATDTDTITAGDTATVIVAALTVMAIAIATEVIVIIIRAADTVDMGIVRMVATRVVIMVVVDDSKGIASRDFGNSQPT